MELAVAIVGLCTAVIFGGIEAYQHIWEAKKDKSDVQAEKAEQAEKHGQVYHTKDGKVIIIK